MMRPKNCKYWIHQMNGTALMCFKIIIFLRIQQRWASIQPDRERERWGQSKRTNEREVENLFAFVYYIWVLCFVA